MMICFRFCDSDSAGGTMEHFRYNQLRVKLLLEQLIDAFLEQNIFVIQSEFHALRVCA